MPHITVEYSANLDRFCDARALLDAIYEEARDIAEFPEGGVRVRLARRDQYRVADNQEQNIFVHVHVRIGSGRSDEVRHRIAKRLFSAAKCVLAEAVPDLALSLELTEMDRRFSLRHNTIHRRLKTPA